MKATRSNLPHLIAAAGGAVLIISLFLAWVSVSGASASAWETFSFVDIVLFLIGLATLAVGIAVATGATLPIPRLGPDLLKWFGVIALTIVLTFIFENDNNGFGAFIGLLGSLAILAGGVLTERPDLAARVADAAGVDERGTRPAATAPPGLGSSSGSTASPGRTGASSLGSPSAGAPGAGAAGGLGGTTPGLGGTAPGAGGTTPGAGGTTPGAGATSAGAGTPAGASSAGSAGAAGSGGEGGGPPPGWYPDPQGQARLRYWDGAAWTDQTSA